MKVLVNQLMDFFLPRICPGCSKKLSAEEKPVCVDCLSSILIADESKLKDEYQKNFSSQKIITDFYAKFVFEGEGALQRIIHALKYQKQFKIGIYSGEILAESIKSRNWHINLIIPVPIHRLKKAERGYNQSDFICKGLSKGLNIPYSARLINRTRYTDTQTGLKIKERAQNVANAFKVRSPKRIKGKNVLLVDDISTTGVTLSECAKMIIKANANAVYACSVGTTSYRDSTSSQVL